MVDTYIGIQTQIRNNNQRAILMLVLFPLLVVVLVWLFFFLFIGFTLAYEGSGFFRYRKFSNDIDYYLVRTSMGYWHLLDLVHYRLLY